MFSKCRVIYLIPFAVMLAGCAGPQRTQSLTAKVDESTSHTVAQPVPPAQPVQRMDEFKERKMLVSEKVFIESSDIRPRYDITIDEIKRHQKNHTALIVDARSPDQFSEGHLKDAINLPAGQKEANIARLYSEVPRDQLIIIYCSSAACESGDMVYEYLTEAGFTNMRVYKPGWQQLAVAPIDRATG